MDENPGGRHLKVTDSMTAEIERIAACRIAVARGFFSIYAAILVNIATIYIHC